MRVNLLQSQGDTEQAKELLITAFAEALTELGAAAASHLHTLDTLTALHVRRNADALAEQREGVAAALLSRSSRTGTSASPSVNSARASSSVQQQQLACVCLHVKLLDVMHERGEHDEYVCVCICGRLCARAVCLCVCARACV